MTTALVIGAGIAGSVSAMAQRKAVLPGSPLRPTTQICSGGAWWR